MYNITLKMKGHSEKSVEEISKLLIDGLNHDFNESFVAANEVTNIGETEMVTLLLERYYVRLTGLAVAMVQISNIAGEQQALIIVINGRGTGGDIGGSNKHYAKRIGEELEHLGFEEVSLTGYEPAPIRRSQQVRDDLKRKQELAGKQESQN